MSADGIWKVEMLGPYGWEQIATAFLRKGRYLGASADHYSVGSYEEDGKSFLSRLSITQHGKKARPIFGETKRHIETQTDGKFKKAGKIVGKSYPVGDKKFAVKVRLTRLDALD